MKPEKVIFSIKIEKGTPLNQIKAEINSLVNNYFKIPVKILHFKMPCCNTFEDFNIDNIPLEDYVCACGKTKLFEYKWIEKNE